MNSHHEKTSSEATRIFPGQIQLVKMTVNSEHVFTLANIVKDDIWKDRTFQSQTQNPFALCIVHFYWQDENGLFVCTRIPSIQVANVSTKKSK